MTRPKPRFSLQSIQGFVPEPSGPYPCALVYPSVFTDRQCDRIVDEASAFAPEAGVVGASEAGVAADEQVRRSQITWLPSDNSFGWVLDKLAAVVLRANRTFGLDLLGFTEDLQFTSYERDGDFYGWHQDGLDGELAIRKLSLVVQLSDPERYEGGELEFFGLLDSPDEPAARAERRRRGTVVVFPSFEFHRVTPVAGGRRQSLVCWVGGPPLR